MSWRNVILIFRREVLDQLRDRRTLFMVAVLPMLLYPLMGVGTAQMTALFTEQARTVVILGAADLPPPSLLDGHRFATKWFRSPADAEKLIVLADLVEPEDQSPADLDRRTAAEELLIENARQLRDLVLERQGLEASITAAKTADTVADVAGRETSLATLNAKLVKKLVGMLPGDKPIWSSGSHVAKSRKILLVRCLCRIVRTKSHPSRTVEWPRSFELGNVRF